MRKEPMNGHNYCDYLTQSRNKSIWSWFFGVDYQSGIEVVGFGSKIRLLQVTPVSQLYRTEQRASTSTANYSVRITYHGCRSNV